MGILRTKYLKKRNEQIKEMDQLIFLKRLHRLLKQGYSLIKALDVIAWDEKMQSIVHRLKHYLKQGFYLDEALKKSNFHNLIVIYIYFVRINSNLVTSLDQSIHMFEQRLKAIQNFKRVSRYPILLFSLFFILLFFIQQYVLPSYIEMFQLHDASIQTIKVTVVTIQIILLLVFCLLFLFALLFIIWYLFRHKITIETELKIIHHLPLLRTFITMQTSFYFATHVSLFLKAGLSIKEIVEQLESQQGLPIISHYASLIHHQLQQGYFLSDSLMNLPLMDAPLVIIFQNSNNNASLGEDLATYADLAAEKLERKMIQVLSFIQPFVFIILGVFIIFTYISLMWPMFQLISSI